MNGGASRVPQRVLCPVLAPRPHTRREAGARAALAMGPVRRLAALRVPPAARPAPTEGGARRYSQHDLDRLTCIGQLLDAGLNLAAIGMVLRLEAGNAALHAEFDHTTPAAPPDEPEEEGRVPAMNPPMLADVTERLYRSVAALPGGSGGFRPSGRSGGRA